MIRKQFTILLSLCMLFGALPQKVYAEETETEDISEETVPEETGETEDIPEEVQEEAPAEETPLPAVEEVPEESPAEVPAEAAESEEETLPEVTETEPVIEEEDSEAGVIPETEEPPAGTVPEAEVPAEEVMDEPAEETPVPEPEKPAAETGEPAEEAAAEPTTEAVPEPVQAEEVIEETDMPAEAPVMYTVTLDANGGLIDKELTGLTVNTEVWYESFYENYEYYVYPNTYYEHYVTRSGYKFAGWYRNKSCSDGKEAEEYSNIKIVSDLTLYAKWLPAWKVTFKANGGTFDGSETSVTDQVLKTEQISWCSAGDPYRDGMAFAGWSLVKNDKSTVIDLDTYVFKADVTFYAFWEESVTVTFKAGGGTFSDSSSVIKETYPKNDLCDLSNMHTPERSGYVFAGWYADASLDDKYKVGSSYLLTKNITLYAKWSKYYTVKFDGNGKNCVNIYRDGAYISEKASITVNVAKGSRLQDSSDVPFVNIPSGYAFGGWYTDKACTDGKEVIPESFVPVANTVLYAKWVKEYKVVFKGNGGLSEGGSASYTLYVAEGSCVGEAPLFTHPSKAFVGWYLDSALTKKVTYAYGYVPAGNVTFYAKWVPGVTVTFDAGSGEYENGESVLPVFAKKGSELRTYVPIPERAGYVFAGWYEDSSFKNEIGDPYFYSASGPVTLYAKWAKAVKVVFDAGEGWFWHYDTETDEVSVKNKVSAYLGKGLTVDEMQPYGDHSIYGAKGTGDTDYMQSPVRSEMYMQFAGWYTDKALTKEFNFFATKVTGAMTLYAKYTSVSSPAYVTVTVDPNGGTITKSGSRKITMEKGSYFYYGEDIIVPPAGKKLRGFTTVKDDASTLLADDAVIKKNMTLYAYYKPAYTVILNANGGFITSGSYADGWIESASPVMVFEVFENEGIRYLQTCTGDDYDCVVTNAEGKIFRGWYSDKACTKFVTYDPAAYKFKKNMTLYAKWGAPTASGWKKSNGRWWYKLPNGYYYRSMFAWIGSSCYYFDDTGYMVTGWQKIDGFWYYFLSGGQMVTGWKKISNKWYWFDPDGIMVTGWEKISGKWYYFLSGGAMVTGWKKISGKWYYFLSGGAMVTGWKKIGGVWYYFLSGGQMVTGWKKISGKWYYFTSSGAMVTGSRTIGGKTYQFDSSGVCLNP
ncbi:MAG: InlB B-repeat-containing protein [Solobacterium sp.]|nr:InlB B-repeat-containing protein [Solobacterium sp.]